MAKLKQVTKRYKKIQEGKRTVRQLNGDSYNTLNMIQELKFTIHVGEFNKLGSIFSWIGWQIYP